MSRVARAGIMVASVLLVLIGVLYLFRLEVALELASFAADRQYQAGPTQEIAWSGGADPMGRRPADTIRRPQHEGQNPRRLHEKATRRS